MKPLKLALLVAALMSVGAAPHTKSSTEQVLSELAEQLDAAAVNSQRLSATVAGGSPKAIGRAEAFSQAAEMVRAKMRAISEQ